MDTKTHQNRFGRLLVLVIISTLVAEVVSGSISFSRIQFLPGQFLVYGSAAILVREGSRRLQAGWPTILLLGLAFGLTLEGLTLQSVFSPNFLGNDLTFGRSLGTNWVWTAYMPPFHAFFSICTPILLTEVIYDEEVPQPWADRIVPYLAGAVLLVMLTILHIMFIRINHFTTDLAHLVVLAAVILLLIFSAFRIRRFSPGPQSAVVSKSSYQEWLIGLVSLTASVLWFLGLATVFTSYKPAPWLVLPAAPLIVAGFVLTLLRWNRVNIRTVKDRLALAAGLLGGEMIFGYFVTASNPVDHYAQLTLLVIIVVLLGLLYRKVSRRMDTVA